MVEGHGVHRVAHALRASLVGRRLKATSPNGRFVEGAAAIDGQLFQKVEAIGKNLFAFFGAADRAVVVHVHFGMAGVWAIFAADEPAPEPTATTRLRLEADDGVVSHLSAMTVVHGGQQLFEKKRAELGQDPLRDDADAEKLWAAVSSSRKSIGALIMDQAVFAGPGNIYRAEILFVARLHPEVPGNQLSRAQFDAVWAATVRLLRDGFASGSIITVEEAEARAVGKPDLRRWIYNRATCGRCDGRVISWELQARTCYACVACQPRDGAAPPLKGATDAKVFNSHGARETAAARLAQGGCAALTVAELRAELGARGADVRGAKPQLVARLDAAIAAAAARVAAGPAALGVKVEFTSARDAAREKARAGENRAVEHVAELAPEQARRARAVAASHKRGAAAELEASALGGASASLALLMPQRKIRRVVPPRGGKEESRAL